MTLLESLIIAAPRPRRFTTDKQGKMRHAA